MPEKQRQNILLALDFDWTCIEADSDHHVSQYFGQLDEMDRLKDEMQWTDLMSHLMDRVHRSGSTKQDISKALRQLRVSDGVKQCILNVQACQGKVVIISDANSFFINEILDVSGLTVDQVVTNQAHFESDRLVIQRHVKPDNPHGCQTGTCSVNICKGQEIDKIQNDNTTIIFGGDGQNDFCPSKHLKSKDYVMARTGRNLEPLLLNAKVQAKVFYWNDPQELAQQVTSILKDLGHVKPF